MSVSWGAALRPKQGQSVSGDAYVVASFGEHGLQAAVIDGLGGGEEAARAAQAAAEIIRSRPADDSQQLIARAHTALHGTRGCVLALMTFDLRARSVSYVGVGNIGVYVSGSTIKPISKNGIIGYRLPHLLKLSYSYNSGDTFVLYSDGISSRIGIEAPIDLSEPPQQIADTILARHGKHSDDATVLVVRPHA